MHGFTYSGHPVGGAIGLANLQIMDEEGLVENAARVGPYLLDGLRATIGDHPYVGDLRGQGLMIAVEFTADRATRRPFAAGTNPHRVVSVKALELELMVRPLPFIEVIPFSPPLCMTEADCDEAVERFGRALEAATPELDRLAAQKGA
jgi:L-2,4-diaminobutyrate transaminase